MKGHSQNERKGNLYPTNLHGRLVQADLRISLAHGAHPDLHMMNDMMNDVVTL